jgi:hypothetical protein
MRPRPLPEALRRLWPHLVAAFVVLHIGASVADALPNPAPGMDRRAWREPRVRHELNRWATRLGMERAALEDLLWETAHGWIGIRRTLLTPFRPYLALSGVKQNWSMFVAGSRYRDRFQIRARACAPDDRSCEWVAVYTRSVEEEGWWREKLEHPRVRSGTFRWVWPDHARRYQQGCVSLARALFAERADAEAVQCRFERSVAPGPHVDKEGKVVPTWGREIVVRRENISVSPLERVR